MPTNGGHPPEEKMDTHWEMLGTHWQMVGTHQETVGTYREPALFRRNAHFLQ